MILIHILTNQTIDADLFLWFLGLRSVMVAGCSTVGAVVFTVVIGGSGIWQYQKLLNVTLEKKGKKNKRERGEPVEACKKFPHKGYYLSSVAAKLNKESVG